MALLPWPQFLGCALVVVLVTLLMVATFGLVTDDEEPD